MLSSVVDIVGEIINYIVWGVTALQAPDPLAFLGF